MADISFAAPPMRKRLVSLPHVAVSDPPPQITRWAGPPVGFGRVWQPKLFSNTTLKSHGEPAFNWNVGFSRADTRTFQLRRALQAVSYTNLVQGGSGRAIPAVFVPTSPANAYGSFSPW